MLAHIFHAIMVLIPGCTDATASNYDPAATVDDGSCIYAAPCTSPTMDGYTYDVVAIGDACWFAENLRTTQFANGDIIPETTTNNAWKQNTTPLRRKPYGHNADSLASVGYHYTGWCLLDDRGVCPSGWRPPTMQDFQLMAFAMGLPAADTAALHVFTVDNVEVGTDIALGTKLMLPEMRGNNASGFAVKRSGRSHGASGTFVDNQDAPFFTTTPDPGSSTTIEEEIEYLILRLNPNNTGIDIARNRMKYGTAVRCVREAPVSCEDPTACNYDENNTVYGPCEYATTVWYLDADGDGLGVLLSDSTACTQPTGYVSDNTDNCDNLAAENYNAEGNTACIFPATSLSDSLVLCTGAEDLLIDLDTIHSYTGVTGYSLTSGFSGTYASAALNGSVLTCDFSGEGTGADTLVVAATVDSGTQQLTIYIEEAMYPRRTAPVRALAASFPGADDGGLEVEMEGTYDDTVTVHFLSHQDQTLVNGLTQLSNEMYHIQGYTNVKGCTNFEPATETLPPANPIPQRLMVPCVPCADHNTTD